MRNFINIFLIKPSDFINLFSETRNTSISRERYIDLIKVVSIFLVIFSTDFFLSFESSGYEILINNESTTNSGMSIASWYLNGIAVFFFCNGFSNSIAWYSNTGRDGSVWEFLANRINSILGPMLVLIVIGSFSIHYSITNKLIPEYFVTSNDSLHPTAEFLLWPLWLVSIYLVVLMFSPITAYFHKKRSFLSLLFLLGVFLFVDLFTFTGAYTFIQYLNYLVFWLFIHQLGYFYADGTIQEIKLAYLFLTCLFAYLSLYIISTNYSSVSSISNFRLTMATNEDPPTIVMLLSSIGLISFFLVFRNYGERILNNKFIWSIVSTLNAHLYTYFLWHTFFFVCTYFFNVESYIFIPLVILFVLIVGSTERNTFRLSSSLVRRINPDQPWPLPIKARFSINNVSLSWYGSLLILLSTVQITLGGVGTFGFFVDRQLFFLNGNTFEAFLRLAVGMILLNITIRSAKYKNLSLLSASVLLFVLIVSRIYLSTSLHIFELLFTMFGLILCVYSYLVNRNNKVGNRVI